MTKLIVEIGLLNVPYFDNTVFNTKCIAIIHIHIVMMNFYKPVVDILSIEKVNPLIVILYNLFRIRTTYYK